MLWRFFLLLLYPLSSFSLHFSFSPMRTSFGHGKEFPFHRERESSLSSDPRHEDSQSPGVFFPVDGTFLLRSS